jgi:ribosomal protein S18 acetylase RimI-like enzyme
LRPATDADRDFLFAVYASTRADELALVPWDDATKHAFLAQQFDAQDVHYRRHYPRASYDVILAGDEPAGRLYVDRGTSELHILDIALLPAFRGRGIGTTFLRDLMAEAERDGTRVLIYVEVNNPARSLYDRLGFRQVAVEGIDLVMHWTPAS